LVRLFELFEAMTVAGTIETWRDIIVRMTRLLAGKHPDAPTLLQDTWAMLSELDHGLDAKFELDAIRLQLRALLRTSRPLPSFQAGGVAVTDLGTDRASPRRLICLVGVDDGTLSGERTPTAFNRLAMPHEGHTFRPGDDARLGLFEFILSARETLAIVWDAGSISTHAEGHPAAPVQELQRHLELLVAPTEAKVTAKDDHAAPEWTARRSPSTDRRSKVVPWPPGMPIPPEKNATSAGQIRLRDLTALLTTPHRALMNEVLGVKLIVPGRAPLVREPIEPNHLDKFLLAERLTSLYLQGMTPAHARRIFRAEGHLPYGNAGELVFDDLHHKALALATALADIVDERTTAREQRFPLPLTHARIDFAVGETTVSGALDGLVVDAQRETNPNAGSLRLLWRSGRLRARDEVQLWVEHLALTLSTVRAPTSIFVARSPDRGARLGVYTLPPLPRALAAREMAALVTLHQRHLRAVTHFYPDTGRGFAAAVEHAAARSGSPSLRAAATDWFRPNAYGGDEPSGDSLEPNGAFLTVADRDDSYPFEHEDFRETSLRLFAPIAAWLHHGRR